MVAVLLPQQDNYKDASLKKPLSTDLPEGCMLSKESGLIVVL